MVKTIAIAGAGDVAKYIVEELRKIGKHRVVVLSRAPRDWFTQNNVETRITDYSASSILAAIQDCDILVSLLHDNSEFFLTAHLAMLTACQQSPRCKKFIPSECGGNIDKFPEQPDFYLPTHVPVRKALRAQHDIAYVLINNGWFMDYFVDASRRYMKDLGVVWPLDVAKRTLRLPGDGDTPVTFTSARDVAKAFVRLFDVENWDEPHIYVAGDTTTWHEVVALIEHKKRLKLQVTPRPLPEIEKAIVQHKDDADPKDLWLAFMDKWNATGAAGLPTSQVEAQRNKYFSGIHFRSIEELLDEEAATDSSII